MHYLRLFVFLCLVCSLYEGCIFPITRSVDEVHTRTELDTTYSSIRHRVPGHMDNGVVFPSPYETDVRRNLVQSDTTYHYEYPAFIRLGLFESVGLLATARSGKGIGSGIFGVYYNPADLLASTIAGKQSVVFGGGLYRFGIVEYKLRWLRDSPRWTLGTSVTETFNLEATNDHTLMSYFPLYLRKRWYLREEIPYVAITAAGGIGLYPSQYVNLSGSVDVGSIGGLNVRAYLGLISGVNAAHNTFNNTTSSVGITTPYVGLGISLLDFLNREAELKQEWKNHEHSSWDIGLMRLTLLRTNQDSSYFAHNFPIQGFQFLGAPVSIALPVLDYHLYAGTELFNLVVVGGTNVKVLNKNVRTTAIGLGILPLRIGYWYALANDEITLEPYVEYSYYPNSMAQLGVRLNLYAMRSLNISAHAGYITSSGFDTSSNFFENNFGSSIGAFSTPYFGLTIGLFDRIFFEDELRYHRSVQQ